MNKFNYYYKNTTLIIKIEINIIYLFFIINNIKNFFFLLKKKKIITQV